MPNPLFDALFARHAGEPTPFLCRGDRATVTHGDFFATAAQVAHVLADTDIAPGDRVAVQVEKSAAALALYGACVQAGLVFLPLNTAYTVDELRYFLEDSGAVLLVCDPRARATVAAHFELRIETLGADGEGSLADRARNAPTSFKPTPRTEHDLAVLLYTSGTTGRAKGAMLTQRNLLTNARVLTAFWHFTEKDVLLHALPIFHTHGLFVATHVTLLAGGAMAFLRRFDLDQVFEKLPCATAMMGVPTFYTRLLGDARLTRESTAHMRLFVSGSAPLLAEAHARFEARTGHSILERYGMTETNMTTSNPYDGIRRAGTVGVPLPGVEVRVTDPGTGDALGCGEVGQVEVRGPNVFKGYWHMPAKTAAAFRQDGFFITGDLGRVDEDGYLQLVGRESDLIISGGLNIYPKEIELVLDAQADVLESAVVGVPHPDLGETVLAVLVAVSARDLDIERLRDATARSLARFKRPRKLIVVDELPRNAMGKVQKTVLRERYKDLFAG